MDLVDTRAQERENTKWLFATITNVTGALLKNITLGFINRVLPQQLLKYMDVVFQYRMVLEKSTKAIFPPEKTVTLPGKIHFSTC